MWYRVRLPINHKTAFGRRFGLDFHASWSLHIILATALLLISACTLNDTPASGTYIQLEAAPQLTNYSRVTIVLADSLGNSPDTLYDDSLPSLNRLRSLPADGYKGGKALITINGYHDKDLVYAETRLYDGQRQEVLSLDISKNVPIIVATGIVPATGTNTGNNAGVPATVIVAHEPGFMEFPGDTTLSINDSVSLSAEAYDQDGDLAGYAWECNGGKISQDSGAIEGYRKKISAGVRFTREGDYSCTMRLWDRAGKRAQGIRAVHVKFDQPVADAGKDTTVEVDSKILLHGKAWDGFGPIVSRGWKIGSKPYEPISQQETVISAPSVPGELICILTAFDSDSLSASDTLVVKVIPRPGDKIPVPAF
jgi:hypothetical protein